ncbi:MAG: 3-methyladenine DNA glycosylase [Propionibacteriaceae bacterium]|nr:3-methyladenine DNA glycosylase [Propionibacteriaceae bacterium]
MTRLSGDEWRERQRAYLERANTTLAGVLERRRRGLRHPVEDFLFSYYTTRPARLLTWTPGLGVACEDAEPLASRRWHHRVGGCVEVDAAAFTAGRGNVLAQAHTLLSAVASRPPRFGCFGMHEWAMVYRLAPGETRHPYLPLRYPPERVAEIVESVGVRCSHYDAFRFFTPEAVPLNAHSLTRRSQPEFDQGGCLHANMDLYKWAGKLWPAVSSELLLDCYDLARDVREVDMQASAYDLADWGYTAIPVETAAGRADYVARQRAFARRADPLRAALLGIVERLLVGVDHDLQPLATARAGEG